MIVFKHFIKQLNSYLFIIFIFHILIRSNIIGIVIARLFHNLMQVRAFKLPPLPGRKNPPIQILNRANRLFEQEARTPHYSRERKAAVQQQGQNCNKNNSLNRPSSVRSFSRQSVNSRQSRQQRNSSREKSIEVIKDKINHNVKARVSMPSVTAKSWAVYEMKQSKLIYGKRMFKKRQIASLTKMMNLITIIEIMQEFKLAPAKIKFKVSRQASFINGTTAQLQQNAEFSLYDLYFGMMLPSGNDAAHMIAQIGGSLLLMQKSQGEIKKQVVYDTQALTEYYRKQPLSVNTYLAQMNRISKRLLMTNSHFANPHGLSNPDNYSCAQDLCKLCSYCMENQVFRFVVRTQHYFAQYKIEKSITFQQNGENQEDIEAQTNGHIKKQSKKWQNTNKMLKQGWSGLKTGITPNAGPCLAASVQKLLNGRNLQFLVILIDSSCMQARWKQVREIVQWVIEEKIYF